MIYFLNTILLLIFTINLHSQEFKTTIWLEDNLGRMDSVIIGFDPNASESIDDEFGEVNISNQVWSSFEIRAAQIDVSEIISGSDVTNLKPKIELVRYETKTEIIPKNCLSLIEGINPFGYVPFITLFIKTDNYPIIVKWKQSDFQNNCVEKSLITDWPISTWWDVPCCSNLEIDKTIFTEQNNIVINKHLGMKIIDEVGDTLIMLNVLLKDELGTNIKEVNAENNYIVYPNPAFGTFSIPENIRRLNIFDSTGKSISYLIDGNKISTEYQGLIFVQFELNNIVYTEKIMNCWR